MFETRTMPEARAPLMRRALGLTLLTVSWNVVEGVVAVAAAMASGSVALLGFGVDSFVESTSGGVMLWRLLAERRATSAEAVERLDRRAHQLIGLSLFLLAGFIALDAITTLRGREEVEPSVVGLLLTGLSLVVMVWLARAKRRMAVALGSRAMEADAFQTTACWWLSLITLVGIGLNAILGWWWADPVTALGMAFFLVKEGREAWKGDECCA